MESKSHFFQNRNLLLIAGIMPLVIAISIWVLWIVVFSSNPSASQEEKVKIFLSYFPMFLRSTSSISQMGFAAAVGSIVLAIFSRKRANRTFETIAKNFIGQKEAVTGIGYISNYKNLGIVNQGSTTPM